MFSQVMWKLSIPFKIDFERKNINSNGHEIKTVMNLRSLMLHYYMAGSMSGQDEANPVLSLASRAVKMISRSVFLCSVSRVLLVI